MSIEMDSDSDNPQDIISFLDIPDVVIQDHLFPCLRINDLLRLRRVSKASKLLAEEHLRLHHVNNPREVEIRENGDRSLAAFLQIGIPFARIYLNNKGVKFFDNPCIPKFLELYGEKITHLRVAHFFAFSNKTEMPFYEALANLQHLDLEEVDATKWRCDFEVCTMPDGRELKRPPCPIPLNFKNLKTLKFGHIQTARKHDQGYWVDVVECCCQHLEYIGHPRYDHPLPPNNEPLPGLPNPFPMPMLSNNGAFLCVTRVINWRHDKYPLQPNLKYYDLKNFKDTAVGGGSSFDLMFFLQRCYERGVKLLNVDAELYFGMGPSEDEMYIKQILEPVVSVKNINRAFFIGEMPNLEKILVTGTSRCTFGPFWEEGRKPQWPELKTVDMTVDSMELEELIGLDLGPQDTTQLMEFLFEDVVRDKLTELVLRFDEKSSIKKDLPCPRTGDIVASCPNLKILSLGNWVGTNKALSKMWAGLEHLQQLILEDCRGLGNVAFVGENKELPTFFKLKKLKTLTLNGLELMPKVTDTLFKLVLRNMKLQKLHLSSRKPLKTITTSGIKELLTGEFANSIQKFLFTGWTLAGVSETDFKQLESQFRSYYMV